MNYPRRTVSKLFIGSFIGPHLTTAVELNAIDPKKARLLYEVVKNTRYL